MLLWLGRLVGLAALAGLLIGCVPHREQILEIRDLDEGARVLARVPIPPSAGFELEFTHSMYGGWVSEHYELVGEALPSLRRTAVRAQNGGAAEYYARYGNLRQTASHWEIEVAPLEVTQLAVRVDQIGKPRLRLADNDLELLEMVPSGHRVELRAAR